MLNWLSFFWFQNIRGVKGVHWIVSESPLPISSNVLAECCLKESRINDEPFIPFSRHWYRLHKNQNSRIPSINTGLRSHQKEKKRKNIGLSWNQPLFSITDFTLINLLIMIKGSILICGPSSYFCLQMLSTEAHQLDPTWVCHFAWRNFIFGFVWLPFFEALKIF